MMEGLGRLTVQDKMRRERDQKPDTKVVFSFLSISLIGRDDWLASQKLAGLRRRRVNCPLVSLIFRTHNT